MKRFAAALLMLALLTGCQTAPAQPVLAPVEPPPAAETEPPAKAQMPEEPLDPETDPVEELLSSMTTEEKVGQLFFPRCPTKDALADTAAFHVGGWLLFGRDFKGKTAEEVTETVAAYQSAADIPLLIGADEEGGSVVRISSNPVLRSEKFPSPQQLFAAGGMDAVAKDAQEKALLLKSLGVNVNLAPVADVSTDPEDFIYDRAFGQNAAATEGYTRTAVAAMTAEGMGSVLKHFPGYGNNADTHTGIAVDSRPYETFVNSDFLPFRAFEEGNGRTAILVSHNIVECMDPELPASLSPEVHRQVRKTLGFDGVIMTDDLAMEAVSAYADGGSVAVMALLAGNDLLITTDYRTQIPAVLAAVEDGTLAESVIDTACRRVLQWKSALGLLPF